MLQQVLEHIHNRFIQQPHSGAFSIQNGMLSIGFLLEGQKFWITGSALNDGLYTYHAAGCTDDDDMNVAGFADEDFDGVICALAVPPAVKALSADILGWVNKYEDVIHSPYQSESFGGYSYSRATGSGDSASGANWKDIFATRLNAWRKIC